MNEIGKRIRYLRLARGLTLAELGDMISPKTTKQHVWNWENMKTPNDKSLMRIADALGTTSAYIRYGVKDTQTNRVLTWGEVQELRAGDRVWVEHADHNRFRDEVHVVEIDAEDACVVLRAPFDGKHCPRWFAPTDCECDYNRVWRVWILPQKPTKEERESAPAWGEEVE